MADGKVNLTFSTITNLKGVNDLSDGLKKSARGVKDFADAGGKIVGQLSAQLKGPLVDAVGTASNAVRGLVQGGLWGALAAVAVKAIDAIIGKMEEMKKRDEERAKWLRDIWPAHLRRVYSYVERAQQKEIEALDKLIAKSRDYLKVIDSVAAARRQSNAAEGELNAANLRLDLATIDAQSPGSDAQSEYEKAVRKRAALIADATREEEEAKAIQQDLNDKLKAQGEIISNLILAGKDEAEAQAEWEKLFEAEKAQYVKAQAASVRRRAVEVEQNAAVAAAQKAKEDEATRKAEEKRTNALKANAEALKKQIPALDRAIAAQRKLADEWEANAQKMRGKDFATWQREQDAESAAKSAEEKRFGKANASAARRANSIRRDARHGWASARDRAWLAQYDEWSVAQSAGNNPHLSEVEKLEAERAEKVGEIADILSRVEGKLDKAITMP